MIDIISKIGRIKYQQEIERDMQFLELNFSKNIRHILGRQYLDAARLMELHIYNVEHINEQKTRLYNTLFTHYKRVASYFFDKAMQNVNDIKFAFSEESKDSTIDRFWSALNIWIQQQTAEKVTQINGTTKSLIKRIIDKGIKEGKSFRDIAKDIRTMSNITNAYRAMTIAMTETHSATVFSIDTAIKSTGMVMSREWMNAGDERVRTAPFNHVIANGETVGPDEKFVRTGEPLSYPGDPEGSLANLIRCRCLILYYLTRKSVALHYTKNMEK